ncbi:hypothetical protein M514_12532 [Trichuris suis]|uniref:Abnormal cell migration protein 18-like fibronectin type I domain-containing protein n=1 Tax=Trichuris suis TaxID=68888 RepID=A0A085MX87_9BILA
MRQIAFFLVAFALFGAINTQLIRQKRSLTSDENCPDFSNVRVMWKYVNHAKGDPYGCILESGEAIPFGATYKTKNYVLRCDQTGDEQVTMTPIQCVLNGKVIDVNEQTAYNGFAYSCLNSSSCIGTKIIGCIAGNGTTIHIGDTFVQNDFVVECAKENFSIIQKPVGCLVDGKRFDPRQTIASGKYWYKCIMLGNNSLKKEIIGCVTEDGKLMDVSQTFRRQDYVYLCKVDRRKVQAVPIGCIAKEYGVEREFRFGERWYNPSISPLSYLMECVRKEGKPQRVVTHCIVNDSSDNGRRTLEAGCGVKYGDKQIFVCQQLKDGIVKGGLHEYDTSKSIYEAMKPFGVRIC